MIWLPRVLCPQKAPEAHHQYRLVLHLHPMASEGCVQHLWKPGISWRTTFQGPVPALHTLACLQTKLMLQAIGLAALALCSWAVEPLGQHTPTLVPCSCLLCRRPALHRSFRQATGKSLAASCEPRTATKNYRGKMQRLRESSYKRLRRKEGQHSLFSRW